MSILNALGKGVMPQFSMRGSRSSPFTNVSQDMLNTAAAGEAMRQSIADKYSSDLDAFYDGTAALKDIFGTKEPSIEDLISDSGTETISSDLVADEEPSGFSFSDIFSDYTSVDEATGETTDQSTGEAILARGTTGLALSPYLKRILIGGKGNPYVTAALAIPEALRIGGNMIAPEATAALEESIGAGYNQYFDPYVSPVMDAISEKKAEISAAQDIEDEIFRQGLIDQGADEASQYFDEAVRGGSMTADELDEYENMILDPLPSFDNYYADGGRVHAGIGGTIDFSKIVPSQQQQALTPNKLAYGYTPFMDAQQGFDYYTQFQNPTFTTPAVRVEDTNLGEFGSLGPQLPEGFSDPNVAPIQKPIVPVDPRAGRGPEDRPGYVDPGKTGTQYGFVDGKLVYTGLSPTNVRQGIKLGDEVGGIASPTMAIAKFFGSMLPSKETLERKFVPEGVKNFFSKKEADPKPKFDPAVISKLIDEAKIDPTYTGKVNPKLETELKKSLSENNNKIGNVKGEPFGGFTAKDLEKGKLVGYGFDPATGKFKGAVQSKSGPVVSDPTKNKKLQEIKNRFKSKKKEGGGGNGAGGRDRGDRRGCFVKGTMIQMADGTEKEITTIEVGEETKGGQVQAKMEFLPERIYDYKGVKVSGSHWVIEDDQFIEVDNSKHGVLTDRFETVYCFKTSDNRIWIKDIEFGDFETGSDADWEPHFEMVKQKLNKELREKRKENQQSDERV